MFGPENFYFRCWAAVVIPVMMAWHIRSYFRIWGWTRKAAWWLVWEVPLMLVLYGMAVGIAFAIQNSFLEMMK